MEQKNKNELIPTSKLPTPFVLLARALVGGYLIYTAGSLVDSTIHGQGRDVYFFGISMVAFAIIGMILIILSAKSYIEGRYVGGKLDGGEDADIIDGADFLEKDLQDDSNKNAQKDEFDITEIVKKDED